MELLAPEHALQGAPFCFHLPRAFGGMASSKLGEVALGWRRTGFAGQD